MFARRCRDTHEKIVDVDSVFLLKKKHVVLHKKLGVVVVVEADLKRWMCMKAHLI